jgi:sugar phosphate isomerase/epimerase
MLSELGFAQYAYDWRSKHLASLPEEISLAREKGININAVWCWIDQNADRLGALSADNERLFDILQKSGLKTEVWLGFNSNFFENLSDAEKVAKGAAMVQYVQEKAAKIGCTVALYNHGDWFGHPDNEIRIIKATGNQRVGMVYSFHHAHAQMAQFPALLQRMLPYLSAINLNGMKQNGPQILPVGQGDEEASMIETIRKSGFTGRIGLLGHVEEEDVRVVLSRNLAGLQEILRQQGDKKALKTYRNP